MNLVALEGKFRVERSIKKNYLAFFERWWFWNKFLMGEILGEVNLGFKSKGFMNLCLIKEFECLIYVFCVFGFFFFVFIWKFMMKTMKKGEGKRWRSENKKKDGDNALIHIIDFQDPMIYFMINRSNS